MTFTQRALQVLYKWVKGAAVGAMGGITVAASSGLPVTKSALISAAVCGTGHALFNMAEQQGGITVQAANTVQSVAPMVAEISSGHVKQITDAVIAALPSTSIPTGYPFPPNMGINEYPNVQASSSHILTDALGAPLK